MRADAWRSILVLRRPSHSSYRDCESIRQEHMESSNEGETHQEHMQWLIGYWRSKVEKPASFATFMDCDYPNKYTDCDVDQVREELEAHKMLYAEQPHLFRIEVYLDEWHTRMFLQIRLNLPDRMQEQEQQQQ